MLKRLIFAGMLWIADLMIVRLYRDGNLLSVFDGIDYGGRLYFYMLHFFVFACYSMYIHGEFEGFVNGAGIYKIVREGRNWLFARMSARLACMLFVLGAVHLTGYGAMNLFLSGRAYLTDLKLFIHMLFVNIFVYYFVFFIQMVMELWFSGRIAMYIVMLYYLVGLFIGDSMYLAGNHFPLLQFLFLPNIAMRLRWEKLYSSSWMSGVEMVLLVGIIVVSFFIGRKLFQEKDIM